MSTAVHLLTILIDAFDSKMRECHRYTVIQDTWNEEEDQELLDYIEEKGLYVKTLSAENILKEDLMNFAVLFADTKIVQQVLPEYLAPNTYPICFKPYYRRSVKQMSFQDCLTVPKPFFVKPCGNDKEFDAMTVTADIDLEYLSSIIRDAQELVYVCNIVEFVNEHRMFIAEGELFAIQESSEYILDKNIIERVEPPAKFIRTILRFNPYNYCVIDVGLLNNGQWALVEVNPPFALSSYGLSMEKYYQYCASAWTSLTKHSRSQK